MRNEPIEVPRPPLTLSTANLLRFFVSAGFGRSAYGIIWSSAGDLIRSQSLDDGKLEGY